MDVCVTTDGMGMGFWAGGRVVCFTRRVRGACFAFRYCTTPRAIPVRWQALAIGRWLLFFFRFFYLSFPSSAGPLFLKVESTGVPTNNFGD